MQTNPAVETVVMTRSSFVRRRTAPGGHWH